MASGMRTPVRSQNAFWLGADLVVEIVSPDDNVERDTVLKRADYAEAGIPEYWIVNPEGQMITVLNSKMAHTTPMGSLAAVR